MRCVVFMGFVVRFEGTYVVVEYGENRKDYVDYPFTFFLNAGWSVYILESSVHRDDRRGEPDK